MSSLAVSLTRILLLLALTLLVTHIRIATAQQASTKLWPCDVVKGEPNKAMEYPVFAEPNLKLDWNFPSSFQYMIPDKDTNTFYLVGRAGDSTQVYLYNPLVCLFEGPAKLKWIDENDILGTTLLDSKNEKIYSWVNSPHRIYRIDYKNADKPVTQIGNEWMGHSAFFDTDYEVGLLFGSPSVATLSAEIRLFNPSQSAGKQIKVLQKSLPVPIKSGSDIGFFDPISRIYYMLVYNNGTEQSGEVIACDFSLSPYQPDCKKTGENLKNIIPELAGSYKFSGKMVWYPTHKRAYLLGGTSYKTEKLYVYDPSKVLGKRFKLVVDLPFTNYVKAFVYNPGDDKLWWIEHDDTLARFDPIKDTTITEHHAVTPASAELDPSIMLFDSAQDNFFYISDNPKKDESYLIEYTKDPLVLNPMKLKAVLPKADLIRANGIHFMDEAKGAVHSLTYAPDYNIFEIRLRDQKHPVTYKGKVPIKMFPATAGIISFWDAAYGVGYFSSITYANKHIGSRKMYKYDPSAQLGKRVTEVGLDLLPVPVQWAHFKFFDPNERVFYLIHYATNGGTNTKKVIECDFKNPNTPLCKDTGEIVPLSTPMTDSTLTLWHPTEKKAFFAPYGGVYDPAKQPGSRFSHGGLTTSPEIAYWFYDKNRKMIWEYDSAKKTIWSINR